MAYNPSNRAMKKFVGKYLLTFIFYKFFENLRKALVGKYLLTLKGFEKTMVLKNAYKYIHL